MLEMIDQTLDLVFRQGGRPDASQTKYVQKLLHIMDYNKPYTAEQLLSALGLRSRANLRKNYLVPALEAGLVVMGIPDKPTSRNQTCIKK